MDARSPVAAVFKQERWVGGAAVETVIVVVAAGVTLHGDVGAYRGGDSPDRQ